MGHRTRAIALRAALGLILALKGRQAPCDLQAAPPCTPRSAETKVAATPLPPTETLRPDGSPTAPATSTTPATPTATPTPHPTGTPYPEEADDCEPNDQPASAQPVGIGTVLNGLTLHDGDQDYFLVRLVGGRDYVFEARLTGGGDPRLRLLDASGTTLIADAGDGGMGVPSPIIRFHAGETRVALLAVTSEMPRLVCHYQLLALEEMPTAAPPTSTPGPTPTPSDAHEPNGTFGTAADVAIGYPLRAAIGPGDNDFYRLYVESGVTYRCRAVPQGNLDTNLIVYERSRRGIGGNNNAAPDSPASAFSWTAAYEGWVYVLVGPVAGGGPYELLCTVPPTPTPVGATGPAPTSPSSGDAGAPQPSPRSEAIPTATRGAWATEETALDSPTVGPSPLPPVRVVAYYDENDNGAPDPAEGIVGGLVLLLDTSANRPVDWAKTDRYGSVNLGIPPGDAPVRSLRVSVPFLGFSRRTAPGGQIALEVEARKLPGLIP